MANDNYKDFLLKATAELMEALRMHPSFETLPHDVRLEVATIETEARKVLSNEVEAKHFEDLVK